MSLWGKKDTVYSVGKVNVTAEGVVTKHSGAGLDFASRSEEHTSELQSQD